MWDLGSIPGSGRSPGGEHGNPLQYACLENPMDRGVWQARVHGVIKSQTQLKQLIMHAHRKRKAWGSDPNLVSKDQMFNYPVHPLPLWTLSFSHTHDHGAPIFTRLFLHVFSKVFLLPKSSFYLVTHKLLLKLQGPAQVLLLCTFFLPLLSRTGSPSSMPPKNFGNFSVQATIT